MFEMFLLMLKIQSIQRYELDQWFSTQITPRPVYLKNISTTHNWDFGLITTRLKSSTTRYRVATRRLRNAELDHSKLSCSIKQAKLHKTYLYMSIKPQFSKLFQKNYWGSSSRNWWFEVRIQFSPAIRGALSLRNSGRFNIETKKWVKTVFIPLFFCSFPRFLWSISPTFSS